jgi:hypothetical protein
MKVFFTALLILSINIGIGLASSMDLFDTKLIYDSSVVNQISNGYQNIDPLSDPIEDASGSVDKTSSNQDKGISLWTTIKHCILPHALLIDVFGINSFVAVMFSAPIYLFYLIGIAQLFINIGGKTAI